MILDTGHATNATPTRNGIDITNTPRGFQSCRSMGNTT